MEIVNLKRQVILTSIWCFLSIYSNSLFSQIHYQTSFENPEEVLGLVREAFLQKNPTLVDKVVSPTFCNSDGYFWLNAKILNNQFITNYREEVIEKEFLLKNDPKKLVVVYHRNKFTRSWYVEDIYYKENGKAVEIPKKAFSPLSYASYFNDFVVAIEKRKLDLFGIGPQGKLSLKAIDSLKLQLSNQTSITYKNIVILNQEGGVVFIYLRLKDYTCGGNGESCGWLVESMGSMNEFYQDDIYVQFLLHGFELSKAPPLDHLNRSMDLLPFRDQQEYEELQEASIDKMIENPLYQPFFLFSKNLPKLSGVKIAPEREQEN